MSHSVRVVAGGDATPGGTAVLRRPVQLAPVSAAPCPPPEPAEAEPDDGRLTGFAAHCRAGVGYLD
ncbi:hypothetical protein GXW83_13585 [Streptacidiphilus sp. PB12-B1b]|uniref:hypothetical protein n=1 Tax=Streptacidiphilus sp. PB12-B1b TaxID=2705012 RepID=UPI0015FB3C5F|nr:hypothetical protein [Streptacidiphilus sp. PB12-B1b]QMU76620.1 hypothetical protein GXW83_13585 [Streptacidiphilus sp. PB12-B1b]